MNIPDNIKLLAIKILNNCDRRFSRKLRPGTIYPFFRNYEFIEDGDQNVRKIVYHGSGESLYNEEENEQNDLNIEISAVVGENGSGKSSLVEIFYLGIYLMSVNQGLLKLDDNIPYYTREKDDLATIKKLFKVEIFYEVDNQIICLRFDSDSDDNKSKDANYTIYNILKTECVPETDLFYSIAVNYSIYGLNERSTGHWITRLFRKNDGYRTPLVINPFRTWGNIDIFSEAHLAQSRLLANLNPASDDRAEVLSNRSIRSITFRKNVYKIRTLDKIQMADVIKQLEKDTGLDQEQLFEKIFKTVLATERLPQMSTRYSYRRIIEVYVIKKVVKIARNYPHYRVLYYKQNDESIPSINFFDEFIEILAKDLSHVTLKLRQALNTFRFNMLTTDPTQEVTKDGNALVIPIKEFTKRIQDAHSEFPERELVEFIPNAILMPNIIMDDGSNFTNMSSGEQQFIYSMQSIIYHLKNLNSVFNVETHDPLTFKRVNIILDEIELYFHPEFQRLYIHELLRQIRQLKISNIKAISIIFLTHSPFILSDIPKANILKLRNGDPIPQLDNTFAGNIHTMLSDSFFMKSTIGEFARRQCISIVEFYETVRHSDGESLSSLRSVYEERRSRFYFILDNIGEDVISGALKNHLAYLDRKFNVKFSPIDKEIEHLLVMKNKIDEDLKRRGFDTN